MKTFSKNEVINYLELHLKNWTFEESAIKRDFTFKTFVAAFSFMTAVALEAEKLDHHPDWTNVYNKVTVSLNTHSANGITKLDFDLADKIDNAYKNFGQL